MTGWVEMTGGSKHTIGMMIDDHSITSMTIILKSPIYPLLDYEIILNMLMGHGTNKVPYDWVVIHIQKSQLEIDVNNRATFGFDPWSEISDSRFLEPHM